MTSSSIMALVHCNGQIITDEVQSTIFIRQISVSIEVYESMPLSVLKQVIIRLFVPDDGKSYVVDLCYRCPVYMTDIRNSYHCVEIKDDDNVRYVIGFAKRYEPHARFELMTFIQQHYDLGEQITSNTWEGMEKQLNDSLQIERQYVLHCYLLRHLHFYVKLLLNLIIFCITSCYIKTDYCVFFYYMGFIPTNTKHE